MSEVHANPTRLQKLGNALWHRKFSVWCLAVVIYVWAFHATLIGAFYAEQASVPEMLSQIGLLFLCAVLAVLGLIHWEEGKDRPHWH